MTTPSSIMIFKERANYLEAAKDAARWIRSAARQTEQGLLWLPEPSKPEKLSTISPPAGIYSGNAGTVLFFLQLAKATGDSSYLNDARQGADYLVNTWLDTLHYKSLIAIEPGNLDFNQGLAGIAFTLVETWRATQASHYREAAQAVTKAIAEAARPAGMGIEWTGIASAGFGDGSILLYLLWAADQLEEPAYRDLAVRAGERILELAEPDPRGGLKWNGLPAEKFGMPKGAYMPNFEFGTAGVAYLMARLYAATGDERFLAAAREGAKHVQALATVRDGAALLFYREPDHTDLYYLGYCHGPVGTARPFYELYRITGERDYLEWVERFANGVSASGVPELQTPGLWNVVCQCCGTAGITDFFVSLWAATQKAEYLAFAIRVADQLLSRASDLDGKGYRWYQAWTRVEPWNVNAETGYMIGAAGVGSALLHLYLAEEGKYEAIVFPDNPFPRSVRSAA